MIPQAEKPAEWKSEEGLQLSLNWLLYQAGFEPRFISGQDLVTFCQNSFVVAVLIKPNYILMDTFYSNSLFYVCKIGDTGTACILVGGIDRMFFFSCIEMMQICIQLSS